MKVLKVIVDEVPKTCGYCKFEIPKENVKEAWAVCFAADKEMVYHNCPPPEWCPLMREGEVFDWISVEDELPEVVEINGCCNFVLVRYRDRFSPECGSEYQTSNTIYVNAHPEKFTHWMPIPEPPESEE